MQSLVFVTSERLLYTGEHLLHQAEWLCKVGISIIASEVLEEVAEGLKLATLSSKSSQNMAPTLAVHQDLKLLTLSWVKTVKAEVIITLMSLTFVFNINNSNSKCYLLLMYVIMSFFEQSSYTYITPICQVCLGKQLLYQQTQNWSKNEQTSLQIIFIVSLDYYIII